MSDIDLPLSLHHETVRAKLNKAVEEGKITREEADKKYFEWLKRRRQAAAKAK